MTARSALLGRAFAAGAANVLLHVAQPGMTTLLKSVVAENDDSVGHQIVVWADDGAAGVFATVFNEVVPANTAMTVSVWVVLVPGDRIRAGLEAQCSVWVSGSILVGVQPVQPPVFVQRPNPNPLPS